jgi:glycosyltransferase involved in cell wall biosynthesis
MAVTITCTRYAEPDWLVTETLQSLARQAGVDGEVLFLNQRDDPRLREVCATLDSSRLAFRYRVIPATGLSAARNAGLALAANDTVLFIDSDAVAAPAWALELSTTLASARTAVAGGRIVPRWHRPPPVLARARIVLNCYSMLDLGPVERSVQRIVGASFGVQRARLGPDAHFDERLGRRPGGLLGGEEADLCARALARGFDVRYNGRALVEHQVLPERISYRWLMRRFYYAGMERALATGSFSPSPRDRQFWDYVAYALMLPASLLGYRAGLRVRQAASQATRQSAP